MRLSPDRHVASLELRAGPCVRRVLCAGLVVVSAASACGCAISPKPEPPMEPEPTVDLGQVHTEPSDGFGPWLVSGGPGAAAPAGAGIRVTNLDDELDPVLGLVEADGSFAVEILADEGDEVRLQLTTGALRSAPVDFLVGAHAGSVSPPPRPLAGCLTLAPATQIDAAVGGTLVVRNGCSAAVQLEAPSLRRPVAGLGVEPTSGWPATVGVGEQRTLTVRFEAASGALEEILFVRALSPALDRRPLTVWPLTP